MLKEAPVEWAGIASKDNFVRLIHEDSSVGDHEVRVFIQWIHATLGTPTCDDLPTHFARP